MVRGSYIHKKELEGKQIFPISIIDDKLIKDTFVSKFIGQYFTQYKYIDESTGYVIEAVHEIYPVLYRYRMKVYMLREMLYFDKLFIDGDKILFMNSSTNNIRRINPERIQMIAFEVEEKISIKL